MSIRESGFFRGVQEDQVVKRQKTFRDTRNMEEKFFDFISSVYFSSIGIVLLAFLTIAFPALLIPSLLTMFMLFGLTRSKQVVKMLVGRLPITSNMKDLSDPIPDTNDTKHFKAGGIFLFGKCRTTGQEFWLASKDVLTHILLYGTTGAGKALPLDEKVLTPNGFVDMGSLAVGDDVISIDGTPTTVTGVFPQGREQVYTLTFEDGREVEASGEHLWEVHHKHWNGKYKKGVSRSGMAKPRVLTTLEIEAILQKNKGAFYLPLPNAFQIDDSVLPVDPYLLGALLGDGNFKGKNFRFSNTDKDIINKVGTLIESYGSILKQYENQQNDHDFHIVEKKSQSGRLSDGSYHKSELREIIRNLGLWGLSANEKFIPDAYRPEKISVKQRLELIQGLLDTDGTADKNGSVYFYTTSLKLAKQVQELIWSIGGLAKISEKQTFYQDSNGNKKAGLKSYSINIRYQNPKELFYCSRKLERIPENYQYKNSLKLRIKSVKKSGMKETQCIKVAHERSLFLTRNYVATHNTETLVSLSFNSLALGSGLFYTDAKAAPKLAFQIFTMARLLAREHDFLVVNYGVKMKPRFKRSPKRITNTTNGFANGGAEAVAEILNALLPTSSGDNAVFSNNAQTMSKALMYGLVEKRDRKEIPLSINTIRTYMALEKYIELATDESLSDTTQESMQAYLRGIGWAKGMPKEKLESVNKQHGFSLSYFALPLASLSDTYGHIYSKAKSEFDNLDVIRGRRIAVILIPSLEMSPGQLQNVGQITLSGQRNGLSVGLGERLEGHKAKVLDSLPTNSPVPDIMIPCLSVTDEYAAITTPGFPEILTQGRGLGIGAIVASQDHGGVSEGDSKGAKQIVANTKIKAIMAMDDPQDTWQLVQTLSGEVEVSTLSGYDSKDSKIGGFSQNTNATIEKRARVDLLDLQSQIEGEFHGFFKGKLIRGQTLYANPPIDKQILSINEKIGIEDVDKKIIERKYGELKVMTDTVIQMIELGGITKEKAKEVLIFNDKQKRIIKGLQMAFKSEFLRAPADKAICALMMINQFLKTSTSEAEKLMKEKQVLQEKAQKEKGKTNKEGVSADESEQDDFLEDAPFGGRAIFEDDDEDDEIDYQDIEERDNNILKKKMMRSVVEGIHVSNDPLAKQKMKSDMRYIEKAVNPNYTAEKVNEVAEECLLKVDYAPVPDKKKPTKILNNDVNKIIELVQRKNKES